MAKPGFMDLACYFDASHALKWPSIVLTVSSSGTYEYDTDAGGHVVGELSGSSSRTYTHLGFHHWLPPTFDGQGDMDDVTAFKVFMRRCQCPLMLIRAVEDHGLTGELTVSKTVTPEPGGGAEETFTDSAPAAFVFTLDLVSRCTEGLALLSSLEWAANGSPFDGYAPPFATGHGADLSTPAELSFRDGGIYIASFDDDIMHPEHPDTVVGTQSTTLTFNVLA